MNWNVLQQQLIFHSFTSTDTHKLKLPNNTCQPTALQSTPEHKLRLYRYQSFIGIGTDISSIGIELFGAK